MAGWGPLYSDPPPRMPRVNMARLSGCLGQFFFRVSESLGAWGDPPRTHGGCVSRNNVRTGVWNGKQTVPGSQSEPAAATTSIYVGSSGQALFQEVQPPGGVTALWLLTSSNTFFSREVSTPSGGLAVGRHFEAEGSVSSGLATGQPAPTIERQPQPLHPCFGNVAVRNGVPE